LTWFQLFPLILAIAEVVVEIKPEVVGFPASTQATATLKLRQRCGLLTAQASAVAKVFE
jgi:hypothetical protein